MALDVHIIPSAYTAPVTGSWAGFGFEGEHEELFRIVDVTPSEYPQLLCMRSYYDDTIYSGDDLGALIDEIRTVMADVDGDSPLAIILSKFLQSAQQAAQEKKAVLLYAD